MANNTQQAKVSPLSRFLEFLFGRSVTSAEGRALKQINKNLVHEGYKFFNYQRARILPDFFVFLFKVYEAAAPVREFFLLRNENEYYKSLVLQYSLTPAQRQIVASLAPSAIQKAAETHSPKDLSEKGKSDYALLKAGFDSAWVSSTNALYDSVIALKQFCTLDYYVALKRGNIGIKENDFAKVPRFTFVESRYMAEFLEDFFQAAVKLSTVIDWQKTFTFVRHCPGASENIDYHALDKLFLRLKDMDDHSVFLCLARLVKNNSKYELPTPKTQKDIVLPYADGIYHEFRNAVQEIIEKNRVKQFETLVNHIFTADELVPLKFYNETASKHYEDKGFPGFYYCAALMYTNAFLKKYLHGELSDFVVIFEANAVSSRPDFVRTSVQPYQTLQELHKDLLAFDQRLDIKFSEGMQFHSLFEAALTDEKSAARFEDSVKEINNKADTLIKHTLSALRKLGETFELLQADVSKVNPVLIENWSNIKRLMTVDLGNLLKDKICPHISSFLQLMENYGEL